MKKKNITGNDSAAIHQTKQHLGKQFHMKDLGPLTGIEVSKVDGYASNSAEVRHGSSKPPWNASQVALCDSSLMPSCILMMVSCYQIHRPIGVCMVGGLQYFTLTRPEISFAVGLVDKFIQSPRVSHLVADKRILRYLKA